MFSMWTCFSLLCAATILQSSTSNAEVSLKCNDTVEVDDGEDVTLNCSITGDDCEGVTYQWSNSHGDIQCNSDLKEYICGWDKLTYVYLTISNVIKEENYTVTVHTDCGIVEPYTVKLQVKQGNTTRKLTHNQSEYPKDQPSPRHSHVIPTIGILITIAAVGMLCFLFRTNRRRQIISRMKKGKTQRGIVFES